MPRRFARAAGAALTVAALAAAPALAHEGNPSFRSIITAVEPAVEGLRIEVLNFDDRLLMTNRSDRRVTIEGYDGEPYARLWPDGRVEVNQRSPAVALNDDRFAQTDVPASASARQEPQWKEVARTGRFEWHDHRMHWMNPDSLPPQVTDESVRTKVFDWTVPLTVGDAGGRIAGELVWVGGDDGGVPAGAWAALGVVLVLSAGLVVVVRRRRADDDGGSAPEVW